MTSGRAIGIARVGAHPYGSARAAALGALLFLVLCGPALAHGGDYGGPGGGLPGTPRAPGGGTPRSGGATPGTEPTWRNWWDRNREDFYDVRARRLAGMPRRVTGEQDNTVDAAAHQPATAEDVREQILPLLVKALKDPTSDVRDSAAIAIGRVGDAAVVEHLVPLLGDANQNVREAALLGLGLSRSEAGAKVVAERMADRNLDSRERGVAALALGLSGTPVAEQALLERFGSAQPIAGVSRSKARDLEGHRAVGLALVGKPALVATLVSGYEKDKARDDSFRPMTLTALARLRAADAGPLALDALEDRDNDVRRSAAILAGRAVDAGDEKQVKALVKAFESERDAHATQFLSISLGRIGHPLAVAALREVAEDGKQREERAFAALGLGISGDPVGREILTGLLTKEKDQVVRGAAAIALGIAGDRAAIPLLRAALDDTGDPELRSDIVTALAMLGDRDSLPTIRKLTGEARQSRLTRDCGFALAVLADEASLRDMLEILRNSSSLDVKGGMASALGRAGDRRLIPLLVEMASSEKETDLTRAFAIVALGLIGDKAQRSEFARIAIDSNYALLNSEALKQVIDIF